ncbi:hypothetical protein GCM10023085_33580 [Actinomadura viridis]
MAFPADERRAPHLVAEAAVSGMETLSPDDQFRRRRDHTSYPVTDIQKVGRRPGRLAHLPPPGATQEAPRPVGESGEVIKDMHTSFLMNRLRACYRRAGGRLRS